MALVPKREFESVSKVDTLGTIRHTSAGTPVHAGEEGSLVDPSHPAIVESRARWAATLPQKYDGSRSTVHMMGWQHDQACEMYLTRDPLTPKWCAYSHEEIAQACEITYWQAVHVLKRLRMLNGEINTVGKRL